MKFKKAQRSRVEIVERNDGFPAEVLSDQAMRKMPREKEAAMRKMRKENQENSLIAWLLKYDMLGDEYVAFDQYGKPYLPSLQGIHFNLTHCRSGVACLVSDRECGIDMEDRITFKDALARHICTAEELKMLAESDDKDRLLTRLWTIKEAYVKMIGTGLAYGLKNVDTNAMQDDVHVIEKEDYCLAVVERKREDGTFEPTMQYIRPIELLK